MQSPVIQLREHINQHLKPAFDKSFSDLVKSTIACYNDTFLSLGRSPFLVVGLFFNVETNEFVKRTKHFEMESDTDKYRYQNYMFDIMLGGVRPLYMVGFIASFESWFSLDHISNKDIIEGKATTSTSISKMEGITHHSESIFLEQKYHLFSIARNSSNLELRPERLPAGSQKIEGRLTNLFALADEECQKYISRNQKPPFPLPDLNRSKHGNH